MRGTDRPRAWRIVRGMAIPLIWAGLMVLALWEPLLAWYQGESRYARAEMRLWVRDATLGSEPLPRMVAAYLDMLAAPLKELNANGDREAFQSRLAIDAHRFSVKREDISEHIGTLGETITKRYANQLPLFLTIYRMEVRFETDSRLPEDLREPIVWDSGYPRPPGQYEELNERVHQHAVVTVLYQMGAYSQQQRNEKAEIERWWRILGLVLAGIAVTGLWLYLVQKRERDQERRQTETRQQIEHKERRLLEEEVRRQEAELRQEDTERELLEQRLATEAVEREALELKSQLYAGIGIMAGSYAHNIKNLLVRPNDLLRRCLESDGLDGEQTHMLHEVRQTLGTVTERLQQILRTVRRDPSRSELASIDLNDVARDIADTWSDLARDKWKLDLALELDSTEGPLLIQGDRSHLQQAVENLLFNARDATFEMRNHLRLKARELGTPERGQESDGVRQALIAAAGWRGSTVLRTLREGVRAVLEVRDNGIGMTEEVRRRCTETHFSTKRDNALYEGAAAGMGLGLSFVVVILGHHGAELEIQSKPYSGTLFRARFPLHAPAASEKA